MSLGWVWNLRRVTQMKDKGTRKSLAEMWKMCIPFTVHLGQQVKF